MDENAIQDKNVEHCYDFMKEKKWIFVIGGYGNSKSFLYMIYTLMIFGVLLFPGTMAVYGIYEIYPNKQLVIDAFHVILNSTFGVWGLLTNMVTKKSLNETRDIINSGFYFYKGERSDEEEQKLREGVVQDIRKSLNSFLFVFLTGSMVSTFYFPISQMMLVTEEEYERSVDTANPYLPHFFHLPFSTRPLSGFAGAFTIILFFHYYVYGTAAIMYIVTISCAKQLEVQLKILNRSIRNIQKRALDLYISKSQVKLQQQSRDDLYKEIEFQHCVSKCLRANVEHHQALLRFCSKMHPFNASSFLLLVIVASISQAALFSLILENPSVNFMMIYASMLLSEQFYTVFICKYGESVMAESSKLFESLYATEWWNYNKNFSRVLGIFMCYSRQPMKIKALLIDFTASLEAYGSFQSAMYKFLNVMRESDSF